MSLTRTINYTQNVPVNLGFSNYFDEVTSPTRTVSIQFDLPESHGNLGTFVFPETTGVVIEQFNRSPNGVSPRSYRLTGQPGAVNDCLNAGQFRGHYYSAETLEQNFLSQNRLLPEDCYGEICLHLPAGTIAANSSELAVSGRIRVSSVSAAIDGSSGSPIAPWKFRITRIDSSTSPDRIWIAFQRTYEIDDTYFASARKSVAIGNFIQANNTGINIAPITDVSYGNAAGTIIISATATDSLLGGGTATGILTMVGSFFIAEPVFTDPPDSTITATTSATWHIFPTTFAAIDQADDNYSSVQLLLKYWENDPRYLGVTSHSLLPGYPTGGTASEQLLFVGNAINTRASLDTPTYITGIASGTFGYTMVGVRESQSPTDGVVRWHFYGMPDECNSALSRITYYRPAAETADLKLETRIVNGRTRIYSSRGK